MKNKIVLIAVIIISTVIVSGCVGQSGGQSFNVTELAKTNQAVKTFLEDYPNAKIIATLITNASIASECENPQLPTKDYWKVTITDNVSNLTVTTWIDADTRNVVCLVKTGGTNETEITESTEGEQNTSAECELTCSGNADICKEYICVFDSCTIQTMSDCCGNYACESNESFDSCYEDCPLTKTAKDLLITKDDIENGNDYQQIGGAKLGLDEAVLSLQNENFYHDISSYVSIFSNKELAMEFLNTEFKKSTASPCEGPDTDCPMDSRFRFITDIEIGDKSTSVLGIYDNVKTSFGFIEKTYSYRLFFVKNNVYIKLIIESVSDMGTSEMVKYANIILSKIIAA